MKTNQYLPVNKSLIALELSHGDCDEPDISAHMNSFSGVLSYD